MEAAFSEVFRIGRGEQCGVRVDGGLVSREHAEVIFEGGTWQIRDLNSTNGLYVDGTRVQQAKVEPSLRLRFGKRGPVLSFWEEGTTAPVAGSYPSVHATPRAYQQARTDDGNTLRSEPPRYEEAGAGAYASSGGSYTSNESVSQIINRYFDADQDQPAGERTQMIRQAYASVKQKEKRKYTGVIATVGALLVVALIATAWLTIQNRRMASQAEELFSNMKQSDLELAQLRAAVLGSDNPDADVVSMIEKMQAKQRQAAQIYDGFIEEQDFYRKLQDDEKLIYKTARIFNESELGMPFGFVEEVKRYMYDYWLSPSGRAGYKKAIQRAHDNGYTPFIVETMQKYGLPPEFFFLAMQESVFQPKIVGPSTRWGIAKGMWQFIPSTGKNYGLEPGPRADTRVYDPLDERHDVEKATDAAARYLLYIYSTPAQASGLLVMASYNWGEHRVIKKLEGIPNAQNLPSEEVIKLMMEGIPMDPDERNYWGFLTKYRERMPEETKDYVLKIFSAAVIGQDPRFFGFDFDPPLKPYMELTARQTN
ncbi:MAG TPA: transglycosylase SLT domain-containing protein [Rhodothermales bacterium]|nr:transglycosylase SLT domain-containing protein [Rhodothermales bacterium]